MKKNKLRDPSPTKAQMSEKVNVYPESPIDLPRKRSVSDVANKRTFINDQNVYRNREVEQEGLMASNFFYNNVDPRRKQELSDARMVQEDHNAMSNLSGKALLHTWNPDEYVEHLAMYNQSTKARR